MALRSSRFLSKLLRHGVTCVTETPIPAFLQVNPARREPSASPWDRSVLFASTTANLPEGHKNSDLRDVACNIRLSRMRDITLRRDVLLYEADQPHSLASIFKGKRALLVGIPGGKVCCQEHLPGYLDKANELGKNLLDKIVIVYSTSDDALSKLMTSSNKSKICFYEDRNLNFARMLGLERDDGPRTQRFAAVVNDGLLLRMNVETHPREVKETTYDILLDVWKQFCGKP